MSPLRSSTNYTERLFWSNPPGAPVARLDLVSFLIGLVLLPFFVWAWIKHDADEDAAAALSIAAWLVIGVCGLAAAWYAFG